MKISETKAAYIIKVHLKSSFQFDNWKQFNSLLYSGLSE